MSHRHNGRTVGRAVSFGRIESGRAKLMEMLEKRQLFSGGASPAIVYPSSDARMDPAGPRPGVVYTQYTMTRPIAANANDSDPDGNGLSAQLNSSPPLGLTPAQVRKAYGIDKVRWDWINGDGAGQTIAIIDVYDHPGFVNSTDPNYWTSDLHNFNAYFGLPEPPSFRKVDKNGGTQYPQYNPQWGLEIALDVEWAHVMAPKANILLVEADQPTADAIFEAVDWARRQPGVSVVSMSLGAYEAQVESTFDSFFTTPAGHDGVTFVAGSGDVGSLPIYPSASPNVVSVGGTYLSMSDNTGTWSSETGWQDSGGGISHYEAKPGYQNLVSTPSSTMRTTPDVAAVGDPSSGVAVYDSALGGASDPWAGPIGGTSLSAPLWAGMIAVANQGRAQYGFPSLDGPTQALPHLYSLNPNDFHDITTGTTGLYSAGPGYDMLTGRGSPKADILVRDLAGAAGIMGNIYVDKNANGAQDSGEPGLAGVNVFVDLNDDGLRQTFEPMAASDSNGTYIIRDLAAGRSYTVRQITPANYFRTSAATQTATLGLGSLIGGKNFGNFPTLLSGNAFTLRQDPAHTNLQIFTAPTASGSPAYSFPIARLNQTQLSFGGTADADVMNIDMTNGLTLPTPSGVNWIGGGNDRVVVTGSVNFDTLNLNVGNIAFDGGFQLLYSGVSSIGMSLLGGNDTVNVNGGPGAWPIATSIDFGTFTDTLNVLSGTFRTVNQAGAAQMGAADQLIVNVSPGATMQFDGDARIAMLFVDDNAAAVMLPNGNHCLTIDGDGALVMPTGMLDFNDNDMIWQYTASSPLGDLQTAFNQGRNGGAWNGPRVTSSAARNNPFHNTTLALMEASDYQALYGAAATFDGHAIDSTAVLIKYTYYGDTDFNGKVNFDDYTRTDSGFNNHRHGWLNGDFDGNGEVNFDDYVLIDLSNGTQGAVL